MNLAKKLRMCEYRHLVFLKIYLKIRKDDFEQKVESFHLEMKNKNTILIKRRAFRFHNNEMKSSKRVLCFGVRSLL